MLCEKGPHGEKRSGASFAAVGLPALRWRRSPAAARPAAWGRLAAELGRSGLGQATARMALSPTAVHSWISTLRFLCVVSTSPPFWAPRYPTSGSPQRWVVKIHVMSQVKKKKLTKNRMG